MSNSQSQNPDAIMTGNNYEQLLADLSLEDLQKLIHLAEGKSVEYTATQPIMPQPRRDVTLPKSNGVQEDFGLYINRLEARIEMDLQPYLLPD